MGGVAHAGSMAPCPACLTPHPQHFVVKARTDKPWRGKSFDADAAVGEAGIAMMRALDLDPANRAAFLDFATHVHVRAVPGEAAPARLGTDRWDIHVGVSGTIPAALVPKLREAALAAVRGSRGFVSAEPA